MDEYDEPIQLELRTDREVAVFMHAMGLGSAMLIDNNFIAGAQTASNLQIRLATAAPERAKRALDDHGDGGVMSGLGEVSNEAAVGHLIAEEEVDPDEAVEGML